MRLSVWRREKGLTQEQLADLLNCSQPYVSLLERSVRQALPATEFMERLYRVTAGAVTPNDLVFPDGLPDLTPELPLLDTPAPAPLFEGQGDAQHGRATTGPRQSTTLVGDLQDAA